MAGLKRLVLAQRLVCGLKTLVWPVVVVFSSVGWGQGEMPTPGPDSLFAQYPVDARGV